jgi:hypothetical protein
MLALMASFPPGIKVVLEYLRQIEKPFMGEVESLLLKF